MKENSSFCDLVRNVVIIASSSRGGSSIFAELLRKCPEFIHLRAEMNPILHVSGLTYPASQSGSDALSAKHLTKTTLSKLSQELSLECGNLHLGVLCAQELNDYAFAITRRLSLQWPEHTFHADLISRWLFSTFDRLKNSFGWVTTEVRDPQLFWCVFLKQVRKDFSSINPYYYDLNRNLIQQHFGDLSIPKGPPFTGLIEEPPFIIPLPLKYASNQEINDKALVSKTPSNVYRFDFLKALFPNATMQVLHLTRNAHSINGLIDGWCHSGFFSHYMPGALKISGYSDRFPMWGRDWWNFDLPPGWQDYCQSSLADICAFQWLAAHQATLEYINKNPKIKYLRIRSEDVLSDSEDTRIAIADKIARWIELDSACSLTKAFNAPIEPVMATAPPAQNRWYEKSDLIASVLTKNVIKDMIKELGYAPFDLLNSASFGGPLWVPRQYSHRQELGSNAFWYSCGVGKEWAPLKSVLLAWPQDSLDTHNLDQSLLLGRVNLQRLRDQTEALAHFYESQGIRVFLYRPTRVASPNLIFMRDTFFMTPEGAILGRMGGQARASEERFTADALISNGIPIVQAIIGNGCFEGADALWISDKKVIMAGGFRTNAEGILQVSSFLSVLGVQTEVVTLPKGTQHLLGMLNFVDEKRAVVRADLLTPEIQRVLDNNGISLLAVEPSEEVSQGRATNFVTLRPNCIVMPTKCPLTRAFYEKHGIECLEADVSEYINAGGALGCLTGIIERS